MGWPKGLEDMAVVDGVAPDAPKTFPPKFDPETPLPNPPVLGAALEPKLLLLLPKLENIMFKAQQLQMQI